MKTKKILAIINGERGRREIQQPLQTIRVPLEVLDWKSLEGKRWSHLHFAIDLTKTLRKTRAKIVVTDLGSIFLLLLVLFRIFFRYKIFFRCRGNNFRELRDNISFFLKNGKILSALKGLMTYLMNKSLYPSVHKFIPVSTWLSENLGVSKKSEILYLPCDESKFKKRSKILKVRKILAVTNFDYSSKIRALEDFLVSYSSLISQSNLKIDIAGSGLHFNDFAEKFRSNKDVKFLGNVKNIFSLYSQYDLFIHFSYLDAYPYVVLEAQASKLPVVVNNCCGMLEEVEDNKTGLIVDLADTAETKKKIMGVLLHSNFREQLIKNGFESVKTNNSYSKIGNKLNRILK